VCRRYVLILLAVEDVKCFDADFGVTVLAGLGGKDLDDFGGTRLE